MASHRPLHTQRLSIQPADAARLESLLSSPESFSLVTGLKVADQFCPYPGLLASTLSHLRRSHDQDRPWLTPRFVVLTNAQKVIGCARFKSPPKDGRVELGYSIAPAYQNQGFATETVRAITEHAFSFHYVETVLALTAPEAGASARVLEKCGFQHVNEILDSVEGLVWLWERSAQKK